MRGRLAAAVAVVAVVLAGAGAAAILARDDAGTAEPSALTTTAPTTAATVATTAPPATAASTPASTAAPVRPRALPLARSTSTRCRFPYPRGWQVAVVDQPSDGAYRSMVLAPSSDARVVCEVDPASGESAASAAGRLRTEGSSGRGLVDVSFRRGPRVGGRPSFRWDYVQRVGGTRVRTSQLFFDGGTLLVQAPTGVYDDLRPTVDAIFRRFAQG